LARWVRDERRRMETVAGTSDEPLSPAERSELLRLRRLVAEQEKDLAFLGKSQRPSNESLIYSWLSRCRKSAQLLRFCGYRQGWRHAVLARAAFRGLGATPAP
jgi:hypothetical protein